MAELRDEYLDYLNTSGLLDEERHERGRESQTQRPSSSARALRPGEPMPSWGGGDVVEPLLSPGDFYGPIAAKLGTETADLLVPYLMKSVSRMAPMLTEAMRAARGSGKAAGPVSFEPQAEGLFAKIDDILASVRDSMNPRRSMLDDISEAERQAIRDKVAEEFGVRRARQAADDEAYLAGRKADIDAASQERADAWRARQPAEDLEPASQRRVVDYDAPAPADKPTGEAKQYEDIIRKLFEAGGR